MERPNEATSAVQLATMMRMVDETKVLGVEIDREVAADELPDRINVGAEKTEGKGRQAGDDHVEVIIFAVTLGVRTEQQQVRAVAEVESRSRHAGGEIHVVDRLEQ